MQPSKDAISQKIQKEYIKQILKVTRNFVSYVNNKYALKRESVDIIADKGAVNEIKY